MTDDKCGMKITEKHVFFYANRCPLSNFYTPCSFTYSYHNDETHRFFSSEQAFMWHKAMFFKDYETAKKILFEGNENPKFCKDQGRLVKNYDDKVWDEVRYSVFYVVNLAKFSQDETLKKFILDDRFEGRTFVEASPYDGIWGIKMRIGDEGIDDENNWNGRNLLGKCITEVRNTLKNNNTYQSKQNLGIFTSNNDDNMKYTFSIDAEGNDNFMMYRKINDTFVTFSDNDIDAFNSLIQYCLKCEYQNYKITNIKKEGKAILDNM